MKFLLLFFAACFVHQCAGAPGDGLVFAHVLFRHGDRNIISPFGNNDPFSDVEKYWPGGFGTLTKEGEQQQYDLGKYLANRYRTLIGKNSYKDGVVYCRSTDTPRAVTSAAHTLAGMFPSSKREKWNSNLGEKWQTEVNSVPENDDIVLNSKRSCPKWTAGRQELIDSVEMKKVVTDNADFFKDLAEKAGRPVTRIGNVNVIYQTLTIEKLKGLKIPQWAEPLLKPGSKMEKIAMLDFGFYGKTTKMARIRPGFLLNEILDRFKQKINGTLEANRKLWLYSAHDVTIANVLGGLNVFDKPHIPPYSACVFFELHKKGNQYHIEVSYKKERTDKFPQPLKLKCGFKCPLNEFYAKYNDILPTQDYDTECKI